MCTLRGEKQLHKRITFVRMDSDQKQWKNMRSFSPELNYKINLFFVFFRISFYRVLQEPVAPW